MQNRLENLLVGISEVASRCGRNPVEARLIAVSKTYPITAITAIYAMGQRLFGENRPQEMKEKYELLRDSGIGDSIEWHLIGQLQKNKVKYIAPFVHLIHSLDSLELMIEINKQALRYNRRISCLIQINISDEPQKSGVNEEEAFRLVTAAQDYPGVLITGLMGMASFTENTDMIRTQFAGLKNTLHKINTTYPQYDLRELSMGMSGDYVIAIEEGATLLRIGSAIFGER